MVAESGPAILVELADYVHGLSYDALPPDVIERAKTVLFHNLIVALGARNLNIPGQDRVIWPEGAPRTVTATRLTDGRRGPNESSVYTNSLLMGARAQHDEHPGSVSHFGSCVIPPLLAVSENRSLSGRVLIVAMVAGYQVGAGIGGSSVGAVTRRGFRPTGLFGPFAAAAAVAKARGVGPTQLANALAIAASSAAGITQMWRSGTDEWRYQTAAAARNGFFAATLAEDGAKGAPDAFEGASGFHRAFTGQDTADRVAILDSLNRWAVSDVILKPFPVCAINQAAVQRTVELRDGHGFGAEEVDEVVVVVSQDDRAYPGVDAPGQPPTATAAMMSMQFSVGVALAYGGVDVGHLADHGNPSLLAAAAKVRLETGPPQPEDHRASVRIRLRDGRCMDSGPARAVEYDRGGTIDLARHLLPASGLSWSEMSAVADYIFSLEDRDDVGQLLALCLPSRGRQRAGTPMPGGLA